jgi:hypothetical protein
MARMPRRSSGRMCVGAVAAVAVVLAVAPAGVAATDQMTFVERHVSTPLTEGIDGSRGVGSGLEGLEEPSVVAAPCPHSLCKGGVILYLTARAAVPLSMRSATFFSRDRGKSWHAMPGSTPTGSTRPVGGLQGDEADFAADGSGRAWLFDSGSAVAPLYGFCGFGASQCDYVPTMNDKPCGPNLTTDRTWIAYGAGKLLLVANNGYFRPLDAPSLELAVYDPDGDPLATNVDWTTCNVGVSGVTGHPAVASNGDFVIPKGNLRDLWVIEGNVNRGVAVDQLSIHKVDGISSTWQFTRCATDRSGVNYGAAAFDARGARYLEYWTSVTEFTLAGGAAGAPLETRTFDAHGKITQLWLTGSQRGDGALVTWAVERGCTDDPRGGKLGHSDLVAAHLRLVDGVPTLVDETKIAEDVPGLVGDYMGSWLGPDGNAYFPIYSTDQRTPLPGTEPLSVFVQTGGPTL